MNCSSTSRTQPEVSGRKPWTHQHQAHTDPRCSCVPIARTLNDLGASRTGFDMMLQVGGSRVISAALQLVL